MVGWNWQKRSEVLAASKLSLERSPGSIVPDWSAARFRTVAVWGSASWLVQVTVPTTGTRHWVWVVG